MQLGTLCGELRERNPQRVEVVVRTNDTPLIMAAATASQFRIAPRSQADAMLRQRKDSVNRP